MTHESNKAQVEESSSRPEEGASATSASPGVKSSGSLGCLRWREFLLTLLPLFLAIALVIGLFAWIGSDSIGLCLSLLMSGGAGTWYYRGYRARRKREESETG